MDFSSLDNMLEDFQIQEEREESIQSQYSASPHMLALIYAFQEQLDPEPDMALFYQLVFDLESAEGWGLDNWGRILGVGRYVEVMPGHSFGFTGSELEPLNMGPFHSTGSTNYHSLTDEAYRRRLWLKALANISPSDAATINTHLNWIYGDKPAYILDNQDMTIRAVFEFTPDSFEMALFRNDGLLARAGGVGFEWLAIEKKQTFGFAESGLKPFNQGVYHTYGGIQTGESL